jgi:hypothetical protein
MNISDLEQINFGNYPKSNDKQITWTKKDNKEICELHKNCSKLIYKINHKSFDDTEIIFDKLPTRTQMVYENFSSSNNILFNYDYIVCFFIIILIITIIIRSKKN